eukprot:SAG11_NODE_1974_length_3976_cov_1.663915_1_plen_435_part_00
MLAALLSCFALADIVGTPLLWLHAANGRSFDAHRLVLWLGSQFRQLSHHTCTSTGTVVLAGLLRGLCCIAAATCIIAPSAARTQRHECAAAIGLTTILCFVTAVLGVALGPSSRGLPSATRLCSAVLGAIEGVTLLGWILSCWRYTCSCRWLRSRSFTNSGTRARAGLTPHVAREGDRSTTHKSRKKKDTGGDLKTDEKLTTRSVAKSAARQARHVAKAKSNAKSTRSSSKLRSHNGQKRHKNHKSGGNTRNADVGGDAPVRALSCAVQSDPAPAQNRHCISDKVDARQQGGGRELLDAWRNGLLDIGPMQATALVGACFALLLCDGAYATEHAEGWRRSVEPLLRDCLATVPGKIERRLVVVQLQQLIVELGVGGGVAAAAADEGLKALLEEEELVKAVAAGLQVVNQSTSVPEVLERLRAHRTVALASFAYA